MNLRFVTTCLLVASAGCVESWHDLARDTFQNQEQCAKGVVPTYRGDISQRGSAPGTYVAYEVTGCGKTHVYECQGFDFGDQCSAQPDWCVGVGCTTDFDGVARRTFKTANYCPTDRISVTHKSPTPPPDVAADPGRLAIWTRQRDKLARHDVDLDVQGCDAAATYHCVAGKEPTAPRCTPSTPDATTP